MFLVSSTATGEMVCTTKSVVVASILSTAILQVCIVIVCVLCIQVHRKSTKDISPHPGYGMSASSRNHSHCSSPSMPVNPGIEINYGSNTGRACGYSTARRPIDNIRSSALRDWIEINCWEHFLAYAPTSILCPEFSTPVSITLNLRLYDFRDAFEGLKCVPSLSVQLLARGLRYSLKFRKCNWFLQTLGLIDVLTELFSFTSKGQL